MITDSGLNYDQNVKSGNTAPVDFYMGLISNDFTVSGTLDVTDIGTAITEFTDYSSATRPALTLPSAVGATITASPVIFTVNANSSTVYGAFIATNATKNNAVNGFIYAIKKFATPELRDSGQDITVNFTFTESNA